MGVSLWELWSLCVGVAVFGGCSLVGFSVGLSDVYRFEFHQKSNR